MKKAIFLLIPLFWSCELFEPSIDYPGDQFSRNLSYAVAELKGPNEIHYKMDKGIIELHINGKESYVVDHRGKKPEKTLLTQLHYDGIAIDNSLRYFIRENMNEKTMKAILGMPHEKWGDPVPNMLVWKMADGRQLGIMPSIFEMPEGMRSFSLFNDIGRLSSNVKMIPYGSDGSQP